MGNLKENPHYKQQITCMQFFLTENATFFKLYFNPLPAHLCVLQIEADDPTAGPSSKMRIYSTMQFKETYTLHHGRLSFLTYVKTSV